eukprot:TRINITY_DN12642_c0_g1_i1.p1 TRINITY_DN12642_c0_g1~~TRINITY_DN12642_c0_g1_i1.p1  ORF type:complete len:120 (+),score=4.92 TRINITY_DN12642_c0_g1_i1:122-481(+)
MNKGIIVACGAGLGVVGGCAWGVCYRRRLEKARREREEEERAERERMEEEEAAVQVMLSNGQLTSPTGPPKPQLPISRLIEEASSLSSRTVCSQLKRTSKAHEAPSSWHRVSSASSLDA